MPITSAKIFPSIGVSRLGNSPTDFFIGPELPRNRTSPEGGYRDGRCRIKRQAARFRIFGFDGATLVKELTLGEPEVSSISWMVHLANKKASWKQFDGLNPNAPLRNGSVTNRASLEVDPGPRTLTGPNQAAGFLTGTFLGKPVPLGEMRTDSAGRLLVLGGFGRSGSVPPGVSITHYANNDQWHDDVSDGPVTATVVVDGTPMTAAAAWVLCAPPDFAPPIESITSLYDVLLQVAIDNGLTGVGVPATPSLTQDVYPILRRVSELMRVNDEASFGHSDFSDPSQWDGTSAAEVARRQAIFNRIRDPNNTSAPGSANMPLLWDDENGKKLTITRTQYQILERWKTGNFLNDWPGSPPGPATTITPEGLTRAALEACVGAAFFPGIEASWFLRDTFNYSEPFRLDPTGIGAGDVSKQMAVPWQADFWKCQEYDGYGWWPAQRPDDVFPEGTTSRVGWTREIVTDHQEMVDQWQKLGFVVEKGGALVETERVKVCKSIFFITDRSHFSEDEVNALLAVSMPARFQNALYVVVEGLTVSEVGFSGYSPSSSQIASAAPTIAVRKADNSTVPGMSVPVEEVLFEDTSRPVAERQRVTFVYRVEFQNTNAFVLESENVTATASKGSLSSSAVLTLLQQPNPYMLDGETHWLSTDVRVFQITEGDSRFGVSIGSDDAAAISFINGVIHNFNALGASNHPYQTIATDPQASKLELSERVNEKRVFNFAVARVRYRGQTLDAADVRVFFRLFTTAATGLDYDQTSTYRRTPTAAPISLLGLQGGHVVTIPCYGTPRVNTATTGLGAQTDPLNVQTIVHGGAGEVQRYFGCWLDFNQTAPQFPLQPSPPDGPWASGRKSNQELIRGLHQCLVAEVHFAADPIAAGATPASNDNLSQRNLAIVESDNPGSLPTRTVQHTFEIKASAYQPEVAAAFAQLTAPMSFGRRDDVSAATAFGAGGPDELMIRWNNVPRETTATLYMPDVDVNEVLRYAGQNYEAAVLEAVDAHTLGCPLADVTYVPLPTARKRNIPALLTLELPDGVKRGQQFDLVVHQISGRTRTVLGAFQLTIPVATGAALLDGEERRLSVLRHIALAIPADDPWRPIFGRYLRQMAERVRGFGGDPESIEPSPDGSGVEGPRRCARLAALVSGVLALLLAAAAWHPLPSYLPEGLAGLGLLVAGWHWVRRCKPSRCRRVIAALVGAALGVALAAVLSLFGLAGSSAPTVLATGALLTGALAVLGTYWRCFSPPAETAP